MRLKFVDQKRWIFINKKQGKVRRFDSSTSILVWRLDRAHSTFFLVFISEFLDFSSQLPIIWLFTQDFYHHHQKQNHFSSNLHSHHVLIRKKRSQRVISIQFKYFPVHIKLRFSLQNLLKRIWINRNVVAILNWFVSMFLGC